jgi:hypothetical protein
MELVNVRKHAVGIDAIDDQAGPWCLWLASDATMRHSLLVYTILDSHLFTNVLSAVQ